MQKQKGVNMYIAITAKELEVILSYAHNLYENTVETIKNEHGSFLNITFTDIIGSIITDYSMNEDGLLDALGNFSECVDDGNIISFEHRKGDDAFGIEFLQILREEITLMVWAKQNGNVNDDYYFPKYQQIDYLCRVIGSNDYDSPEEFYTASCQPDFIEVMEDYFDSPGFEEFCKINGCAGYIKGGEPIIPIIVSRIILGGVQ